MALPPRSSLRSLVLLMSHGKPRLRSFFSSSPAAVPPPGNCAPAAPAAQPPAAPALPDSSSQKRPPHEELPIHDLPDPPKRGNAVIGKRSPFTLENPEQHVHLLCTVDKDPQHPTPDCGASYCSTPEPVSGPGRENVQHPLPDPGPRPGGPRRELYPEYPVPSLCTVEEDPKHLTPDCGASYTCTPEPMTGLEDVKHPVFDPPRRP